MDNKAVCVCYAQYVKLYLIPLLGLINIASPLISTDQWIEDVFSSELEMYVRAGAHE
jgi:hypothetical protein